MVYYIAREKDGDSNMWLLQDIDSGKVIVKSNEEVKKAMKRKSVNVINLQVDAADRLIKQSQYKFNMESVQGLQNAPDIFKTSPEFLAEPCTTEQQKLFDSSIDTMMYDVVDKMYKLSDKFLAGKVLSDDKNLFQVKMKVKDRKILKDDYLTLLVRYEHVLNCKINDPERGRSYYLVGDILLGIRAMRLPDGGVVNFDTGYDSLAKWLSLRSLGKEQAEVSGGKKKSDLSVWRGCNGVSFDKPYLLIEADKDANVMLNDGNLFRLDNDKEIGNVASAILSCISSMISQLCQNHDIPGEYYFDGLQQTIVADILADDRAGAGFGVPSSVREKLGTAFSAVGDAIVNNPVIKNRHRIAKFAIGAAFIAAAVALFINIGPEMSAVGAARAAQEAQGLEPTASLGLVATLKLFGALGAGAIGLGHGVSGVKSNSKVTLTSFADTAVTSLTFLMEALSSGSDSK